MSAKVTISRRSNTKGEGGVAISIDDEASGLKIVEVQMELTEFAEVSTGLGYCKAEYRFKPNSFTVENIDKTREVKNIFVDRAGGAYDKDKVAEIIKKHIEDSGELIDGWMLHDDGTRSQQHGDKHRVSLKRFV